MKKNNLYDFLLILFIYIAFTCFPFEYFVPFKWLVYVIRIIIQIGLIIFKILFTKYKTNLAIPKNKIDVKNLLLLLPCIIVCFSNYFYLLFFPNDYLISFDSYVVFEIIIMLLVAINEEFLFRLVLINNLENKSDIIKVIISAAIFGVSHIVNFLSSFNPFDLIQIVYTFALGIYLGIVYCYVKSFVPCIILHFLFNTFNSVIYSNVATAPSNLTIYYIVNTLVAIIVGIYLLFFIIIKRKASKAKENPSYDN